ncbi:DNA repair exonuclease SbcCD nuclease subunit [Bacillus pakistanensis]|uniref:DNA repair exonuclease SbcCD nuclease subunit n=1 Tax=Rossellomorea pakistanensis TaxID=992288 RepID=A0ABS2NF23_9BACI|nr:DNA repair exonuclease [Bacillus pakistanensis]MBM7586420.1 DNA repair exonuclease SbcCD nuclease subunit [Bacillus pakistanensis]
MEKIKFIHSADLHLDSPFKGLRQLPQKLYKRIMESTFQSFKRIIDKAISSKVDFVLISGDLFDEEDRSIKAQARLREQFQRLNEIGIPAFVIHGNHDFLGSRLLEMEMPENVHIFGDRVEKMTYSTKNGQMVHLYGFSYGKRHIVENQLQHYPIAASNDDYHIGLLHGSEGNSKTSHEKYAPFTIAEMKTKQYDYWALGHIHTRSELSSIPPIVYPGNIQGRHSKETGPKGCYEVHLTKNESELNFITTNEIRFEEVSISLKNVHHLSEVYDLIKETIESYRKFGGIFLEMKLQDADHLPQAIHDRINNGEMVQALQDGEELHQDFVWIHQLKIENKEIKINSDDQQSFIHTYLQIFDEWIDEDWERFLSDLYQHPQAFRYLETLSDEEKEGLLNDVKSMTNSILLGESR